MDKMEKLELLFHVIMIIIMILIIVAIIVIIGKESYAMALFKNKCIAQCVELNKQGIMCVC